MVSCIIWYGTYLEPLSTTARVFQQSEFDNFGKVRIRKVDQKQQDMLKNIKATGFFFWYQKHSIV